MNLRDDSPLFANLIDNCLIKKKQFGCKEKKRSEKKIHALKFIFQGRNGLLLSRHWLIPPQKNYFIHLTTILESRSRIIRSKNNNLEHHIVTSSQRSYMPLTFMP